jgi:hypothetical protein
MTKFQDLHPIVMKVLDELSERYFIRISLSQGLKGKPKAVSLLITSCLLVSVLLTGCSSGEGKEQKRQTPQIVVNPKDKIEAGAVYDIDRKNSPKLYQAWGKAGIDKLNRLQPLVALKAAESPNCDRVEYVSISDNRSVPRKRAVFFADCRNGQRFYISEDELQTQSTVASESDLMESLSDGDAIARCEALVRQRLNRPSSFDKKALTTNVQRFKTLGRVRVSFDFTGTTGLGIEVKSKAECLFGTTGIPEVTIEE